MKKRKKILIILGVILVVAAAAAFYIYKEYNRTHKDTADMKPDYSVNASNLIREFETGEQAANKKYWDKIIEVDGVVKDISKDDKGFYSVVLGDTASMSSVRCSLDSVHNVEAAVFKKGSTASLRGICTGFNADELLGSDVILVRCAVTSKK
jgi:hypothetical protein